MDYQYISIDRIFSKLGRDVTKNFDENDVIEWCGEALEFTGAVKMYQEDVAFIEVRNHQFQLPIGMHAIIQIARNNNWSPVIENNLLCPKAIVAAIQPPNPFVTANADCDTSNLFNPAAKPDYIVLDCNGMPLNDYDVAYYRPYFNLKADYNGWSNSSYYRQHYSPVRLKTDTMFGSLVCKENDYANIYHSAKDEYTIVQGSTVRVSFREGSVAVAYLKQVMDTETGYPMIPDNISYTTAIVKYIALKMAEKDFDAGRDGSASRVQKYESDWHWYCGQASAVDKMPFGIDEHQNLLDQRSYMLPRQNNYFNFFGNMAEPEQRKWNNPDHRNRSGRY